MSLRPVSFTVRRPSPLSQSSTPAPSAPPTPSINARPSLKSSPLSNGQRRFVPHHLADDDSDQEEGTEDELVTGFDELGVQRVHKRAPTGPLVIPALKNRDWREIARARKGVSYVPESAKATTGADGSQGGLGTRDTINSGPTAAGLQKIKREAVKEEPEDVMVQEETEASTEVKVESEAMDIEETLEQQALRALLSGDDATTIPQIDAIRPAVTETDAYQQDVVSRPDSATLGDYERVPVEQFGAALLRGMGWKEGMAASRTRTGPVEPYLPAMRPALLGIGAKERVKEEVPGANGKKGGNNRPDKRYMPVLKRAKDSDGGSRPSSRRASRSPSPPHSSRSSRHVSRSPSPRRDRGSDRERDRDRRRRDDARDSSSRRHSDRDSGRERDKDRDDYDRSKRSERRRRDDDDDRRKDRDRR